MKTFNYEIQQDEYPENPRDMFDHAGTMVCWHNRYTLGDEHQFRDPEDFQKFVDESPGIVVLPLYLYDHSGITMSTGPFNCSWDSGQVGYIYMTKEQAEKERIPNPEACLESEVKEYDAYISGDVYEYQITDNGEIVDSCSGFFGYEYCVESAESQITYLDNQEKENDLFESVAV